MIVGQNARIRFEYRANNQMVSRLFTDHPVKGIKDVGLELVREGLALPQLGYDYRYGELSAALAEAQQKQRGVWRIPPPR
jgi:endonuclease YncB( thermonuclease family)